MISSSARVAPFKLLSAGALGFALVMATAPVAPAQTPANAIIGVTVLDVAPGTAAQGVAILKQYREGARKQPGNLGVDVLQEIGHPNRFVVYETWQDQAAFDANEKAAPSAELRDKLKPIDPAAMYDRRNFRVTTVGPVKPAKAGAVYWQVHLDVIPPFMDKTVAAVKEVAEAARKGAGNLRYDVVRSVNQPTSHQTIYAAWESRKDFDEYEMSRYNTRFRDAVGPGLGSPFDDRLYTLVD
jgi:quinol monooxygenase YgiN